MSVTVLERYVQMYECVAAYLIFVIFGTILERYLQMYKRVTGELRNGLQQSSAPFSTKRKKIWASMAICWEGKYIDLNLKN